MITAFNRRNPRGIDFPYLVSMIHDSFMSRANTIVIPDGKLDAVKYNWRHMPDSELAQMLT